MARDHRRDDSHARSTAATALPSQMDRQTDTDIVA